MARYNTQRHMKSRNTQQPAVKPIIILCVYIEMRDGSETSRLNFELIKNQINNEKEKITDAPWFYIGVIGERSRVECLYPKFCTPNEQLTPDIMEQLTTISSQFYPSNFMCVDKPEQFKINKKEI